MATIEQALITLDPNNYSATRGEQRDAHDRITEVERLQAVQVRLVAALEARDQYLDAFRSLVEWTTGDRYLDVVHDDEHRIRYEATEQAMYAADAALAAAKGTLKEKP